LLLGSHRRRPNRTRSIKQKDRPKAALYSNCKRSLRQVAATPDLFRPDRRIAAMAAGWRNDRHIARLGRWCANFRVNSCGRAEHAVGSRQFVAERLRLRGGRGALRRDGALLRHRLRRRATRRIPRGRWRGRLSRWRRRRRRSLRGCRAGCHQSCQDQKKRLSLHGGQTLPRLPLFPAGGETDWRIRSTSSQDFVFRGCQGRTTFLPKTHQRRSWSHGARRY
jgi:hypothetical protein